MEEEGGHGGFEEGEEEAAEGVDVLHFEDADATELAFPGFADAGDFAAGEVGHELHDGFAGGEDSELAVGFVAVRGDFGEEVVRGDASGDGDEGFLGYETAHLVDDGFWISTGGFTVLFGD